MTNAEACHQRRCSSRRSRILAPSFPSASEVRSPRSTLLTSKPVQSTSTYGPDPELFHVLRSLCSLSGPLLRTSSVEAAVLASESTAAGAGSAVRSVPVAAGAGTAITSGTSSSFADASPAGISTDASQVAGVRGSLGMCPSPAFPLEVLSACRHSPCLKSCVPLLGPALGSFIRPGHFGQKIGIFLSSLNLSVNLVIDAPLTPLHFSSHSAAWSESCESRPRQHPGQSERGLCLRGVPDGGPASVPISGYVKIRWVWRGLAVLWLSSTVKPAVTRCVSSQVQGFLVEESGVGATQERHMFWMF